MDISDILGFLWRLGCYTLSPSIRTLVIFTPSTTVLITRGNRPASITWSEWSSRTKVIERSNHFR